MLEEDGEYKLVCRADDSKQSTLPSPKRAILGSAIMELLYPKHGIRYQAMVCDCSYNMRAIIDDSDDSRMLCSLETFAHIMGKLLKTANLDKIKRKI